MNKWAMAIAAASAGIWCATAQAAPPADPRQLSIFGEYPWIRDMLVLAMGIVLVVLLYFMFRSGKSQRGFTIDVDEDDITFKGSFPPHMEQTVIDFLRDDCQIPGTFQVRGHWDERMLIVTVRGDQARPLEQRIRNFLKLNLKPPRGGVPT